MHKPVRDESVRDTPGLQDRRMPRLRASRGSGAKAGKEKSPACRGGIPKVNKVSQMRKSLGQRGVMKFLWVRQGTDLYEGRWHN